MEPLSNAASWRWAIPEIVLTVAVLLVLVLDLVRPARGRRMAPLLALVALGLAALATLRTTGDAVGLFGGLLARDPFADFFKVLALAATGVAVLLTLRATDANDEADTRAPAELYALLLTAALGVHLMAAATHLLVAYLALELVSVVSYALAGFTPRSHRSSEAALKYAIYGGVASACLLYGLSLLYGLAGSLDLAAVRAAAATGPPAAVTLAMVLVVAGLGYKVAAVPFHMWCPDVYEGAPTPVAAFLSVAPKAGGFALLLRVGGAGLGPPDLAGTPGGGPWLPVLLTLAAATMTVGNLAALGQTSLKRLLAYSSIAQAGYVLLGVAAGPPAGHTAALFYLAVYLPMNLAAFAVVVSAAASGAGETLADVAGLGRRMPLPSVALTVALLGLAGLPPTAGFVGKYQLFSSLVERGTRSGGVFHVVLVLAVLNSVVSLAYYARVIRALYFAEPPVGAPALAARPFDVAVAVPLAALTLALGVAFGGLGAWAEGAMVMWAPSLLAGR
jgi:NADH-quinone oxidoreductase subunit N